MPKPVHRHVLRAVGGSLALLLLLAACAGPLEQLTGPPNDHLIIAEVYAAGFAPDGGDQFVTIHNPLDRPFDLAGWSLGDPKMRGLFPPGAQIRPGESLYLARAAAGFAAVMGFQPDAVWGDGATQKAIRLGGAAAMLLRGDEGVLLLRDPEGRLVDQVVWGAPPDRELVGWKGSGAPPPAPGEVLDRGRSESSWNGRAPGLYRADTDTASDWRQGEGWIDRRFLRPGQTFLPLPTFTVRNLTAYASPDSSFAILSGLIDGARERIDLNVYSFTNLLLAEKLAGAARRGVKVRLLMEASGIGALDDQERFVAQLVQTAGGQVRWIMNQSGIGVHGRYNYDHAKYGIVDGSRAFVQSENFGRHGVPSDTSTGNRGWGVAVHDQALAQYLAQVFAADWNAEHGDIFPFKPGTPFGPPAAGFTPETRVPTGDYPHPFLPLTLAQPVRVTPVLAPDHALLESKGISGLIRSARRSILVEQLYIQMHCAVLTTPGEP